MSLLAETQTARKTSAKKSPESSTASAERLDPTLVIYTRSSAHALTQHKEPHMFEGPCKNDQDDMISNMETKIAMLGTTLFHRFFFAVGDMKSKIEREGKHEEEEMRIQYV